MLGTFYCTGYTNSVAECDSDPDITASGHRIILGGSIAVDPNIPIWHNALKNHWIVRIEGLGDFDVLDTGSAIKGYRVDIAVATVKQARSVTGNRRIWFVRKTNP